MILDVWILVPPPAPPPPSFPRSVTNLWDEELGDSLRQSAFRTTKNHLQHISFQLLHHHKDLRDRGHKHSRREIQTAFPPVLRPHIQWTLWFKTLHFTIPSSDTSDTSLIFSIYLSSILRPPLIQDHIFLPEWVVLKCRDHCISQSKHPAVMSLFTEVTLSDMDKKSFAAITRMWCHLLLLSWRTTSLKRTSLNVAKISWHVGLPYSSPSIFTTLYFKTTLDYKTPWFGPKGQFSVLNDLFFKDHLQYKTTYSWSDGWSLNRGIAVLVG